MKKSLVFFGGAGTVTGSKALLSFGSRHILVDAGLFQGIKELRLMNWEELSYDVRNIDCILITHAHLDHVGALPLLVKNGFRGKIYLTAPTADLAKIILLDSAHIQEEEAEAANRLGYTKHQPAKPLYTTKDVLNCFGMFEVIMDNRWINLLDDINIMYRKNGHILGSCSIDIELEGFHYVFSGDVGRQNPLVVHRPQEIEQVDYLVLESTYGNRVHSTIPVIDQLKEVIIETYKRGGHLIIPSFAVERAQEIIYLINELKRTNKISDIPVFLDSPMAIDASEIMCRYPEWHQLSIKHCMKMFEGVTMIREASKSAQNVSNTNPMIVIAGSGMITGGRVLDYLAQFLEDEKHTILLTGYQAEGTRGRDLIEKKETIKIQGKYYKTNAQIKVLNGLSGHADQEELMLWLDGLKKAPRKIFLNHGESESAKTLSNLIQKEKKWNVEVAVMNQLYDLK